LWITGATFGTSCPIFVANILALSISNLLCGPGMKGMIICSFLTIYLGPTMWGNMASGAETKLTGTLYSGENKRFTCETYVRIHTEQHSVLNGLKDYGYTGIDDSSKVHHLLKGIKTT
jgi:hypothetical protein